MAIRIDGTNTTANPGITGGDADTGLQFGTDEVSIVTGGTERAKVDSSGRLLVGTSSASTNGLLTVQCDTNQDGIVLRAENTGGQGSQPGIVFEGPTGTELVNLYADNTASELRINTAGTERMRIDNAGKVGIGQTSFSGDGERLAVKGDTNTFSTYCVRFINSDGTVLFRVRNDGRFLTGSDGSSPYNLTTSISANVWIGSDGTLHRSTSSARFKTEIEDLENEYADQILSLRPVWYRSTAPGDQDHPDWSYYGFIAEEVAEVDPRLVFWKTHDHVTDANGVEETVELDDPIAEGVQYDRLVPHLLNLIKRQKEQIETLETRLTALEGGAS